MTLNKHATFKEDFRETNKADCIDALYLHGEGTIKELALFISNRRRRPISGKTVERAFKNDPRVLKHKTRYRLSEEAQYEIRYQRPDSFGFEMFFAAFKNFPSRTIMNRKNWTVSRMKASKIMDEYIRRYGALVVFSMLEAARPFEDEFMTILERDRLVKQWIRNAIPLEDMFYELRAEFNKKGLNPAKNIRGKKVKSNVNVKSKAPSEIEQSQLEEIFKIFKKTSPDLYENFVLATQLCRKKKSMLDQLGVSRTPEKRIS